MVHSIGSSLMVKNLNKLCFEKLLAVAAVALMCVSMWVFVGQFPNQWKQFPITT